LRELPLVIEHVIDCLRRLLTFPLWIASQSHLCGGGGSAQGEWPSSWPLSCSWFSAALLSMPTRRWWGSPSKDEEEPPKEPPGEELNTPKEVRRSPLLCLRTGVPAREGYRGGDLSPPDGGRPSVFPVALAMPPPTRALYDLRAARALLSSSDMSPSQCAPERLSRLSKDAAARGADSHEPPAAASSPGYSERRREHELLRELVLVTEQCECRRVLLALTPVRIESQLSGGGRQTK